MRIDLMDQAIGQGQIADGIVILMAIEIISIVGESLSQSMTIIEHRRDAIETETIKMELLQPVLAVGEEEMDDIILAIVKAKTIPYRMLVAVAKGRNIGWDLPPGCPVPPPRS